LRLPPTPDRLKSGSNIEVMEHAGLQKCLPVCPAQYTKINKHYGGELFRLTHKRVCRPFLCPGCLPAFCLLRLFQKTKNSCQKQADAYQFPKTMGAGFGTIANLSHQKKSK